MTALPPKRLRGLLRQPRLLLDLQELILISGGPHWLERAASEPENQQAVERGWRNLTASLADERTAIRTSPGQRAPSRTERSSWTRHRWLVSLATAAAVLVAVALVEYRSGHGPGVNIVASSGWGWNRPGALTQDVPRRDYLNRLADGAKEWFNTRPDNPIALARRIAEFRQGCSVLILSPHRPLPAQDRAWLVERCRAWAVRFDGYLASVEGGKDPLEIRNQADETINRLIDTLRDRAKTRA